ncbi:hypothetical protein N7492_003240 [Penicillium capsulatum]|uniref:Mpv17/PMP22 n=1 Tax=Penicillium capsulatum TaxID=69766 RepID=A0A9W9IN98_9EURO|nr:hypothetical protein N7492_003240 [Penicillium capsulatum]KAJ6122173.1 hypothetical protein N7512_004638 [Penicillium capsulatum]
MPSPLTVTFVQSTVLNAISNILAQLIDQRNNTTPFMLNALALVQFITYGILIVPVNFYWQRALEARFPGFPSRAEVSNLWRGSRSCSLSSFFSFAWLRSLFRSVSDSGPAKDRDDALPHHNDKEKWMPRAKRSGLYCFIMKFFFDQTVASIMNIILFVVLINFLKGETLIRSWELVLEDFRPIMIARLKYRPLVSILMYTVIPVDRRVVFGSGCGVIWGIYLSLYAVV